MRLSFMGSAASIVVLGAWLPAFGAEALTLPRLQELVAHNTPQVLAAHTALREAQGARSGATPLFAQNPSITGGAGLTAQPAGWRPRDWDGGGAALLQLQVPIEIGGQRWLRVAAADARIQTQELQRQAAVIAAHALATAAFYRVLHAQGHARVAGEAVALAARLRGAAQQLRDAGLASLLDVELAGLEEAEAAQNQAALQALAVRGRTELLAAVGLSPEAYSNVTGDFISPGPLPTLDAALQRTGQRPDILALRAQQAASLRDASVAAAEALPTPTLGASYQYQYQFPAAQHMVLGQVSFPLPVFARGQGEEARARARARGTADQEHQALLNARAEVRAAHALVLEIRAARQLVSRPPEDTLAMTQRLEHAYVQRQADLGTVLNMQRRLVALRRTALDLDLQEALAWVWLNTAMGVAS